MLNKLNPQIEEALAEISDIDQELAEIATEEAELAELDTTVPEPVHRFYDEESESEEEALERMELEREEARRINRIKSNISRVMNESEELLDRRIRLNARKNKLVEFAEGRVVKRDEFLLAKSGIVRGRIDKLENSLVALNELDKESIGWGSYSGDLRKTHSKVSKDESVLKRRLDALSCVVGLVKMVNNVYGGIEEIAKADPDLAEEILEILGIDER